MRRITGNRTTTYWCCQADFGKHEPTCNNYEKLNPTVHCGESRHFEEPEHHQSGGLGNPFSRSEKVVDTDPEGMLS
jgi:hypothetical protein